MRRIALVDSNRPVLVLALALLAGLYYAANALLLIFACILFAILLQRRQEMIGQHPLLRRIADALPQPKQLMQYLAQMVQRPR